LDPRLDNKCLTRRHWLYILKASGAAFRAHLVGKMLDAMKYKPSYTSPDIWIQLDMKPDGLILCYVDDVLAISADPMKSTKRIQDDFKLKVDKIAEPEVYLGATLSKMSLEDGSACWTMLPEQNVKAAVSNVEDLQRMVRDYHQNV
jgi:hypothetical protein